MGYVRQRVVLLVNKEKKARWVLMGGGGGIDATQPSLDRSTQEGFHMQKLWTLHKSNQRRIGTIILHTIECHTTPTPGLVYYIEKSHLPLPSQ